MKEHEARGFARAGLDAPPGRAGDTARAITLPQPVSETPRREGRSESDATARSLPKRRRGRRTFAWVLGSLALLAVVAVAVGRMLSARVDGSPVVRRDVARTLVLTGRVRPPARPQLGASIGGTVRSVLVREGDRVRRGQLLVRIDDAQPLAALAQARAALATAEARTRSTADQAQLALEQAVRDLDRARTLYRQGAISQRDLEANERATANARSELDAARARTTGSPAFAEVTGARAAVAEAKARVALTRVTAPAAATVLSRSVEEGDAVVAGQMLLELSLDGPTELVAFAREENVAELTVGAAAIASADAYPARTFAARVAWLAPMVDRAQGTIETRFAVPEPPDYLRADMTVSINVEGERRADALVVPVERVRDARSSTPWVVVARDGRAVRQAVRLGITGDHDVEILEGLAEGDLVLPADIEPGERVRLSVVPKPAADSARTRER
ncbi:MAG TPA: efflux RND transporter periplasmic adaptor subunit [Gemmatimonadaceae bacterium]|jgi:HlyD family secretion protein|nr:efflux RND transporter periplasmic adaptor subunit [Gemmatimonadaceae bacterium]